MICRKVDFQRGAPTDRSCTIPFNSSKYYLTVHGLLNWRLLFLISFSIQWCLLVQSTFWANHNNTLYFFSWVWTAIFNALPPFVFWGFAHFQTPITSSMVDKKCISEVKIDFSAYLKNIFQPKFNFSQFEVIIDTDWL